MKKFVFLIALLLVISFPQKTFAETLSAHSATLAKSSTNEANSSDLRIVALRIVLARHGSPLADYSETFVKQADRYSVDWKLLPAISGVESTFGQALPAGSYNAYGWGNGRIYFKNWEDGIDTIDHALKTNYIDHGAQTVWQIGPIYAASPTWSVRVNGYMDEIEAEYLRLNSSQVHLTL